MRRLSLSIFLIVATLQVVAQKSPHGSTFSRSCKDCHSTDGWKIDPQKNNFDHRSTQFPLTGQHQAVTCKSCHQSLEFAKTSSDCNSCHADIHSQTVGNDCSRCHTTASWIVTNITTLHQQSRFPLIGPHTVADCRDCHKSLALASGNKATPVLFEPLGVECIDCHEANYRSTVNPNHVAGNYSTQCTDCHNINSYSWSGGGINHNFFPLTAGHAISDCKQCHTTANYFNTSAECISCHQANYNGTTNPSHITLGFSTNCTQCHTTTPGWKPAEYRDHDARSFPIYSGKHNGEWDNCTDCHKNTSSYQQFTCIDCHEHNQSDMNQQHNGVSGYQYTSEACFSCHPRGDGEGAFNHATSGFPLTGAHITTNCTDCHTNGFQNTPNLCIDCHAANYNQTANPSHSSLSFSQQCTDCHTTNPGWKPAQYTEHDSRSFPIYSGKHAGEWGVCTDCHPNTANYAQFTCTDCHDHNQTDMNEEHTGVSGYQYNTAACFSCHPRGDAEGAFNHSTSAFPLTGAHTSTSCTECHTNGYQNTPNLCIDCHAANYNQTANPSHSSLSFSQQCTDCHTTNPGWKPAQYTEHDSRSFPIYSGKHAGGWGVCTDCHPNTANYAQFTCVDCHEHNQTDMNQEHTGVSGYQYNTSACFSCHPRGEAEGAFNHSTSAFPLTGAHASANCSSCHLNGYENTSTLCIDCHSTNYNQSINPNHISLGLQTSCEDCHTANPGWAPATFPNHNSYYVLEGAHAMIGTNCDACHNGNYTNTPVTCYGCHQTDYTQTINPSHSGAQFPTTCESCHSQNAWTPASFNHDGQYFPIYSGKHKNEWSLCSDCHPNSTNYAVFSCINCHEHNQTDMNQEHQGVSGYSYNSTACLNCHPNGSGGKHIAPGRFNKTF